MRLGTVMVGLTAGLALGTACVAEPLRYYPEHARRMNVEGKAVIACFVTAEGKLTACSVVSEEPAGFDFGETALKMAPLFKMRPATRDGVPVEGGIVRIPIKFQLPPHAAPQPPPPPGPAD